MKTIPLAACFAPDSPAALKAPAASPLTTTVHAAATQAPVRGDTPRGGAFQKLLRLRRPDAHYASVSIPLAPGLSAGVQVVRDRYNAVYLGGGVSAGVGGTLTGPVDVGSMWWNRARAPGAGSLREKIGGFGIAAYGGCGIGVTRPLHGGDTVTVLGNGAGFGVSASCTVPLSAASEKASA